MGGINAYAWKTKLEPCYEIWRAVDDLLFSRLIKVVLEVISRNLVIYFDQWCTEHQMMGRPSGKQMSLVRKRGRSEKVVCIYSSQFRYRLSTWINIFSFVLVLWAMRLLMISNKHNNNTNNRSNMVYQNKSPASEGCTILNDLILMNSSKIGVQTPSNHKDVMFGSIVG